MLRSEAAHYARWSASAALLLAGVTLFVYLERGWLRHLEKKKAPPPAPVEVSRQSNGINFKKVDQNQTIFEVSASRSTEFKGKDDNLLENVEITIFGKTGERHDVIHTQSCQYGKENGSITCGGDVQITLLSARDAERTAGNPAAARTLATHVETRGVTFDRASGVAQTDQRVTFEFPSGHGEALGLEYQSEEGALQLRQNVRLILVPSAANPSTRKKAAPQSAQEVQVKGTRLDFGRDTRLMRLLGPAEAETPGQRLTAGEITLSLDKEFRARELLATGGGAARPTVTSRGAHDQIRLEADTLMAHFSPEGSLTKLDAVGGVHGLRTDAAEQEEANADAGILDLWAGWNQLKELNLKGNVVLRTQGAKSADSRILQTSWFRMQFSGGEPGAANKAQMAETLAAGTMEWTDVVQPAGTSAKTKLQADKLQLEFGAQGKPRQLTATGNVQTERAVTGRTAQTATARTGVAELQPSGGWSQMDLQGDVKLKEGDHLGEGEHALFLRASQTAVLTGKAMARDAATETHAPKITFSQATGDVHAEGGVRSTDLSPRTSSVQLAPAPANITADTLQANSKSGRALYTGHARLWQGDSVLEAQSIELLRESRILNAAGNVRAVFPQTPNRLNATTSDANSERSSQPDIAPVKASQTIPKKLQLWHVASGTLTYHDLENRAHLEKNVIVQSAEQRMHCPVLDLYFTRNPQAAQNAPNGANASLGAQQISRALGSGGLVVEEGRREATAEHGEYIAAAGKFVMSGGNPTLYDGSEGTTTGRQLTFFLADDTIIVDSEDGSRTLTKHRVAK
jgi:lipopolysaccharide export system protein LptA